jgi:hypothetical protein
MPYYTWIHKKTKKIKQTPLMTISEGDAWEAANPSWERLPAAPGIGDPIRLGVTKADPRLQDRIKEIKKAHGRKSTIRAGNLSSV